MDPVRRVFLRRMFEATDTNGGKGLDHGRKYVQQHQIDDWRALIFFILKIFPGPNRKDHLVGGLKFNVRRVYTAVRSNERVRREDGYWKATARLKFCIKLNNPLQIFI